MDDDKRKLKRRKIACVACRQSKARCEQEYPGYQCGLCRSRNVECKIGGEIQKPGIPESDGKLDEIYRCVKLLLNKLDVEKDEEETPVPPNVEALFPNNRIVDNIQRANFMLDFYAESAPLALISQRHSYNFQPFNKTLHQGKREFKQLFQANEEEFSNLSSDFLRISSEWIIPGGIKIITPAYVKEHPFILAVFVLIGMCINEKSNYETEQKNLFDLTTKILGGTLLQDNLNDHDIEALLYISSFNISRKAHKDQFMLNKWLMASSGINHVMHTFNFSRMYMAIVYQKSRDPTLLYHLRIYNLLLVIFIQTSLDGGRAVFITNDYLNFSQLILQFNLVLVGDRIVAGKLKFLFEVIELISSRDFAVDIINDIAAGNSNYLNSSGEYLQFVQFTKWRKDHNILIQMDRAKILIMSYYYHYIYISSRITSDLNLKLNKLKPALRLDQAKGKAFNRLIQICFQTSMKYSFEILKLFQKLYDYLIRGLPAYLFDQIITASLIILQGLRTMSSTENQKQGRDLLFQVYKKIKMLQVKNDAADTLERIMQVILEDSHNKNLKINSPFNEVTIDINGDDDSINGSDAVEVTSDLNLTQPISQYSRIKKERSNSHVAGDNFQRDVGLFRSQSMSTPYQNFSPVAPIIPEMPMDINESIFEDGELNFNELMVDLNMLNGPNGLKEVMANVQNRELASVDENTVLEDFFRYSHQ